MRAMQEKLKLLAGHLGERLLHTPRNPISMALTVDSFSSLLSQQRQSSSSHPDDDPAAEQTPARTLQEQNACITSACGHTTGALLLVCLLNVPGAIAVFL